MYKGFRKKELIPDALNAIRGNSSREKLERFYPKNKIDSLLEVMEDIGFYFEVMSIMDLGFKIDHSEISFDKMIMFSWIKEGLKDGGESRISDKGARRPVIRKHRKK